MNWEVLCSISDDSCTIPHASLFSSVERKEHLRVNNVSMMALRRVIALLLRHSVHSA